MLVSCYVVATSKLVRSSQEQIESQSRPAIVVKEKGEQLELVNIGNGPALQIEWQLKPSGTAPTFSESQKPIEALSYLEDGQTNFIAVKGITLTVKELHCLYRSLSGMRYVSVSAFTEKGTYDTQFHSEHR